MSDRDRATGPSPPPPSPEEWRRLEPIIDRLLDAAPGEREALIAALSGGDTTRRTELERMLVECERSYPPIEGAVADRYADMFGEETPAIPESLAGRYRLEREVGRGGMAIVYLARDLRHGRDVAVKIVRPELAAALGRARFLREIEIAARLRHPNIVPLYDSGEESVAAVEPGANGTGALLYYVMPYEPGHSLRERLSHDGPLAVEDAMLIVRDVCEALSHAHQHGIVHRDIKPENVLLAGRQALVTDFGVARAVSEAATDPAHSVVPAYGTRAYMAPEQAVNDPRVDHRADIYAVGVLAYELLAGRTPSVGEERSASHSPRTPDLAVALTRVRPDVPQALALAIARCLAARPDDRWGSADELRAHLDAIAPRGTSAADASWPRAGRRAMAFGGIGVVITSLVALAIARSPARQEQHAFVLGRAGQLTSDPGLEVQPSISPDGRHVAYAAGHSLHMRIAVRPIDGGRAMWLTADTTGNEWLPHWSPDGSRILFLSRGGVFSAPASGGVAREEVRARPGVVITSAAWSPDGREIAYAHGDSLLARAVGSGHDRLVATGPDLHSCRWSPDGRRLACVSGNSFYVTVGALYGLGPMFGNLAPSRVVIVSAAGGRPASVTDSGSLHQSPVWSRDGRMLYYVSGRQGPRDVYALDVSTGAPGRRGPMRITTGMGVQSIDLSSDGTRIVYAAYTSSANVWSMPIPTAAPASAASAVPVTTGNQTVEGVRVSPDGRWIVYDSDLSGNSDVYRVPVTGGEPERLTRGPMDEFRGALSPDGRELVYHTFQTGTRNLFLQPLDGAAVRQLTHSTGQLSMANWSPDGSALTFFDMVTENVLAMRRDLRGRWSAPRFVGGRGWRPEWSPDGRTIVYVSRADGRISAVPADSGAPRDLYVPSGGEPLAELAIFSADGRELYFKSHDARGGASFWAISARGGRPRLLVTFDDPTHTSNRFEFASDGKRFFFTIENRQSDIWVAEVAPR